MRKTQATFPITNIELLAVELRRLRRSLKATQQSTAEQAGVSRRTVANAEAAENVGTKELCRIANSLGYELVLRPRNTVVYEELENVFKDDE